MANSTLALGSSLNLRRINKSVSSLSESVRRAQTSSASISKSLLESNRDKRKSLSLASTLFRRRREATLRREKEDIIEAGSIVGAVKRTGKVVMNSTKGFLGRILDYLGTVLIGWAVLNLPKIIKLAEDLTKRMQKYFGILQDFVGGVSNFFIGLPDKFGEIFNSISTFNFGNTKEFFDNTLDKLQTSFQRLQNSVNQFVRRFTRIDTPEKLMEYFDLDMKMFDIPGLDKFKEMLGVEDDDDGGGGGAPSSQLPGSGGTKYPKLAALISSGEGGLNSVNRGNAGDTPGGAKSIFGKNLTEMTVGEILEAQRQDKVFAVGMYQFIPGTLRGAVNYTKIPLNTLFDANTQNKLFDYLIDVKRPEIGAYINGKSNDRRTALQQLAREFAAVGLEYPEAGRVRGQSRYAGIGQNAASISPVKAGNTLDSMRSSRSSQSQSQSQEPPAAQKVSFNPATRPNASRATTLLASAPEMPTNLLVLNTTKTKVVERKSPPPQQGSFNMPVAMVNNTHEKMQFTALA